MKRTISALILVISVLALAACATTTGAAVGAGIGSISGNTKNGALIGGTTGLLFDVFGD